MFQPQLYVKNNGLQRAEAKYLLENYFSLLKMRYDGTDAVLDVGCGSGDVTMEVLLPVLPQNIRKLVGCDISDDMVDYAKKNYNRPNVSFVKMDIASLKVPIDMEADFDHVFSFNCLNWVQNHTQAFKNIFNMLKPEGDMLIVLHFESPLFRLFEKLRINQKWETYIKNTWNFVSTYESVENVKKNLESLLKKTGFSVKICQIIDRVYVINGMDILRKSIAAVNPFVKSIPKNLRANFLDYCADEVRNMCTIERNSNNEEKIHFAYKSLVVFGSKHLT